MNNQLSFSLKGRLARLAILPLLSLFGQIQMGAQDIGNAQTANLSRYATTAKRDLDAALVTPIAS